MTVDEIRSRLFEMQDTGYRDFQSKLMPTVDKNTVIGVRVPMLRKFAKELIGAGETDIFLNSLPHKYYEENVLHGFIISGLKDYGEAIESLNSFLPYVDNWAVCDLMSPKSFKAHRSELIGEIDRWLDSEETYTVRFGIVMLMTHFLDDDFKEEYLQRVASVVSDEYYIKMAVAWYFATALAKRYDPAVKYIENGALEKRTHNKTIQKAVESFRITDEQKEYLKKFRCK